MAISTHQLEYLIEMLAGAGPVTARRMFGGAGLYADGIMFALVAGDVLYFKADTESESRYREEGMTPFTYEGRGKTVELSYWRAPEWLYDEPDEMTVWAQAALAAARRSRAKKRPKPLNATGPRGKASAKPR